MTIAPSTSPVLRLVSDGQHWQGTFALAAEALITDILSDGEPFDATLTWVDGNNARCAVASVTALNDGHVEFTAVTAHRVPVIDLIAVEVH